jgi:DNA (cytosine-5)-methyltransferase 1
MIGRKDKNGPQGNGINEDVSFTLNATDRHAVATKAYGIGAYNSEGMKSSNPHSGIYEAITSRTLDLNGGSPACNQGGMAIVQGYRMTAFGEYVDDDSASTVKMRDYKDATDLVVGVDAYNHRTTGDKACSLTANSGSSATHSGPMVSQRYSVRRLTPLECERLQGFPDGWTDIPGQTEVTKEELEFWREAWLTWDKTQAENPEEVKPRTDKRLLKWLKNPVSDSAQYKALGNSVAVPCPEYVLEGIAEVLRRERGDSHVL